MPAVPSTSGRSFPLRASLLRPLPKKVNECLSLPPSPLANGGNGKQCLASPLANGGNGSRRLASPLANGGNGNRRLASPLANGGNGKRRLASPLANGGNGGIRPPPSSPIGDIGDRPHTPANFRKSPSRLVTPARSRYSHSGTANLRVVPSRSRISATVKPAPTASFWVMIRRISASASAWR
jgi:hypothetical protein